MGGNHHQQHDSKHFNKKILTIAFIITAIYAVSEIIFGFIFNSLVLLSEGFHMFSDAISLGLSMVAAMLAFKKSNLKFPFGYRRIETIAAFINGLALLLIPVIVIFNAIGRFITPQDVSGSGIITVAVIGLIVNVIVAIALSRGDRENNINLKSAFLHVFADIFSSIGAITAGVVIMYSGWTYIDPIISIVVSIIIFLGGIKITKESFHILMQGSSKEVSLDKLKEELMAIEGVEEINHLKTWAITSGEEFATVHIAIKDSNKHPLVLSEAKEILQRHHFCETIQIESL